MLRANQSQAPSKRRFPPPRPLLLMLPPLSLPLLLLLALATVCLCPAAAEAQFSLQQTAPATTKPAPTKEDDLSQLETLREENATALRAAQQVSVSESESEDEEQSVGQAKDASQAANANAEPTVAKKPDATMREIELRTQLGYVLDQIKSGSEREQQVKTQVAEETADLKTLRTSGPSEAKPYSFLLLEQLRDELAAEKAREESIDAVIAEAKAARDSAKAVENEKQSTRRKAKETLDTNQVENATGELATALQLAELDARVAQENLKLREMELRIETARRDLHTLRTRFLQEKLQIVQGDVVFTRRDLQDQKLQLAKRQADLNQALTLAQHRANDLEQRWAMASQKLNQQSDKDLALKEQVEAYRLGQQVRSQEVTLLTARLQRLARALTVWRQRYDISHNTVSSDESRRWRDDAQEMLDQLEREDRLQAIRQEELSQDVTTLDKKLQANQDAPPEVLKAIQAQRNHLEDQRNLFIANQESIKTSRRLHEKLLHELVGDATHFELGQGLAELWGHIADAWDYELTIVDERPITVGKIISGMILLLLGIFASRWLSKLFAERFLRRFGMSTNAIPAFQAVSFYLLIVCFTLIALRMVNVPLEVLTFLGGAVAIGLGFGSQNILNNFISGLILLAERPVRVGDVIEIEGMLGTVELIGGRSTRIRNFSNQEIIIPNSTILQNSVVNWTLGNQSIRSKISVGVAYGSATREVMKLMRKAADDHGQTLADPEPVILFTNFGDSALSFDMYVWLPVESLGDRLRIESDLRLMIDSSFRDANISIPFPQRDLHFDPQHPLSIKMLTEPEAQADRDADG